MTEQADLIFTGGPVYTVPERGPGDDPGRGGQRLAGYRGGGAGGRIVAVGTDTELAGLAGAGPRVVELRGRPLLPGFQDAHVHPAFAGLTMLRCDLDGAADPADALARIRAYAAAQPGPGVDRRQRLADGVVPGRDARPRAAGPA